MKIKHYEGWFRAKKRAVGPLAWEAAHEAYRSRQPFTAVVVAADRVTAYIEFNNDYIGVGFLDEFLREYLSYTF